MTISIIIPVFNEEKNIIQLYRRLKRVLNSMNKMYELLFINDGSQDKSLRIIKELAGTDSSIKYINFSRNFGHQIAISAGLDCSIGNSVVIIDADLQDPPELIIDMYNKMLEGYEVVYAKRKIRKGEKFSKLISSKFFYKILSSLSSVPIPEEVGDFKIIDKKVIDVIRKMPEQNKFLRGQIAWVGFRQTFIEYERDKRYHGTTGYSYRKMFKLASDGITSFSDIPLKLSMVLGFIVSGIAFLLMLYALYSRFVIKSYVEGWTSLILCILFLGGVQLISLGIIGEYLGRLSANVRNRPLYIIDDTNINLNNSKIVN